jgi:hypothetical protein
LVFGTRRRGNNHCIIPFVLTFSGLTTGTATTTATTGLSVGPVFANTTQPSAKGLGGVDPQTKTTSAGQ